MDGPTVGKVQGVCGYCGDITRVFHIEARNQWVCLPCTMRMVHQAWMGWVRRRPG